MRQNTLKLTPQAAMELRKLQPTKELGASNDAIVRSLGTTHRYFYQNVVEIGVDMGEMHVNAGTVKDKHPLPIQNAAAGEVSQEQTLTTTEMKSIGGKKRGTQQVEKGTQEPDADTAA